MSAPFLEDGQHIALDLEAISNREGSTRTADLLDAFLNEINDSEDACWKLTRDQYAQTFPDPIYNCELIASFRRAGYFVHRLRPLKTSIKGFRILYAYDGQEEKIHLLAIVRKRPDGEQFKDDDSYYEYEQGHPISQRVREEYDVLELPRGH